MTSDFPTAIPVLAVRIGDTIFKDRATQPLTVDEIDWVLEHEHGPVARFIGVPEGTRGGLESTGCRASLGA